MSTTVEETARPLTVNVASGLLLFNAILLLFWWVVFPAQIESNGAQVFFMILWVAVAWSIYLGFGWVRYGVIVVCVAAIWGIWNAESIPSGWNSFNIADQITKFNALAMTIVLFLPTSRQWFNYRKALLTDPR